MREFSCITRYDHSSNYLLIAILANHWWRCYKIQRMGERGERRHPFDFLSIFFTAEIFAVFLFCYQFISVLMFVRKFLGDASRQNGYTFFDNYLFVHFAHLPKNINDLPMFPLPKCVLVHFFGFMLTLPPHPQQAKY